MTQTPDIRPEAVGKMIDDLIRRANYALGDTQGRVDAGKLALFADCIARIEELEAKLAKAVDALEGFIRLDEDYSPFGGEMMQDRVERTWDHARTTLAELSGVSCANLKGEKDD